MEAVRSGRADAGRLLEAVLADGRGEAFDLDLLQPRKLAGVLRVGRNLIVPQEREARGDLGRGRPLAGEDFQAGEHVRALGGQFNRIGGDQSIGRQLGERLADVRRVLPGLVGEGDDPDRPDAAIRLPDLGEMGDGAKEGRVLRREDLAILAVDGGRRRMGVHRGFHVGLDGGEAMGAKQALMAVDHHEPRGRTAGDLEQVAHFERRLLLPRQAQVGEVDDPDGRSSAKGRHGRHPWLASWASASRASGAVRPQATMARGWIEPG